MIKAKCFFKKMVCVLALMSMITTLCCSSLTFSAYAQEKDQRVISSNEENVASNSNLQHNYLLAEEKLSEVFSSEKTVGETIDAFNEYLEEKGTNAEKLLDERIALYETMLNNPKDDNQEENLRRLIDATENMKLSVYNGSIISSAVVPQGGRAKPEDYDGWIAAVSLGLVELGYDLSAELLIFAYSNKRENTLYANPVFGGRVMASQQFYDIAYGTGVSGSNEFGYASDKSRNEKDLHFAIKKYSFEKECANNKKVRIIDVYDYHNNSSDGYPEPIKSIIDQVKAAQNAGTIVKYNLNITIDAADFLKINLQGKKNGKWNVNLENLGSENIVAYYNSKMCNAPDAKLWEGLVNVEKITVPANGSVNVLIAGNGTATHITFSHVKGVRRFISCADELNDRGKSISNEGFYSSLKYYDNIYIERKNGNRWYFSVANLYSDDRILEYNTKMCTGSDAQNWTGLVDTDSFWLYKGYRTVVSVAENGFSTHAAISLKNDDVRNVYYINELNADGTMNVQRNTLYTNLRLSIVSKQGSTWKIRIYNPSSNEVTVSYNEKMCNSGDAQNWTGLNNIVKIKIKAYSSETVSISENWWATTIAVSYEKGGYRVISYADGLNTNGNINVKYRQI